MDTEFVADVMDEHYLKPVPSWLPKGSLPDQDWDVREALLQYKISLERWNRCTWIDALFKTKGFREAKQCHYKNYAVLQNVANRSNLHLAAFKRIINDMPADNGAKHVLSELLWQDIEA